MIYNLVNYTVKRDMVNENTSLLLELFSQLRQEHFEGLEYTVYLVGEVSFLHLSAVLNTDTGYRLSVLPSFRGFLYHINDRAVSPPSVCRLKRIGHYNSL